MATASPTHAVIQGLNGQTGQQQSFQNDSNIGISSLSNVHTLQWLGLLPVSRGGTGTGSFTDGSVPFISNGIFSENENLSWDNSDNGSLVLNGSSQLILRQNDQEAPSNFQVQDHFGNPLAQLSFESDFNGLFLVNGEGIGLGIDRQNQNIILGEAFNYWDQNGPSRPEGTLQIVETGQTTLYVGSSGNNVGGQQPGCLVMGDSDGDGVTYITANDGVLTASTTKPSICQ